MKHATSTVRFTERPNTTLENKTIPTTRASNLKKKTVDFLYRNSNKFNVCHTYSYKQV